MAIGPIKVMGIAFVCWVPGPIGLQYDRNPAQACKVLCYSDHEPLGGMRTVSEQEAKGVKDAGTALGQTRRLLEQSLQ